MKTLLAALLLAMLAATPVAANDLKDWLQSPSSETLAAGESLWEFAKDTMTNPDGVNLSLLNGSQRDAWMLSLDKDWTVQTGLTLVPRINTAVSAGLALMPAAGGGLDAAGSLGIAVRLTNWKGTELLAGVKTCPGDVSDREVDLGCLGRFHFTTAVAVRYTK